jgi:hypothetical protein
MSGACKAHAATGMQPMSCWLLLWAPGAVFVTDLNPHLAVDLATRVWSCF